MSDSLRVTLVVWRDASTDRPKDQNLAYVTDRGIGVIHPDKGVWIDMAYLLPFDPQPIVWCDPTPPGDDPLTADDLRDLLILVDRFDPLARRLRRAIEALEAQDGE